MALSMSVFSSCGTTATEPTEEDVLAVDQDGEAPAELPVEPASAAAEVAPPTDITPPGAVDTQIAAMTETISDVSAPTATEDSASAEPVPPPPSELSTEPVAEPVAEAPPISDNASDTTIAPVEAAVSPPVAIPAPPVEGSATYIVMPGDTLGKIAKKLLGSTRRWQELAQANNLADPHRLMPGDKIVYSGQELALGIKTKSHVVSKGETLGTIAKKIYGSYTYWPVLWRMNETQVSDPNKILPGMRLSYRADQQAH
jgi:nucleoid-associated protein YgaU